MICCLIYCLFQRNQRVVAIKSVFFFNIKPDLTFNLISHKSKWQPKATIHKLPNCRIATLPHYRIATLSHCHIVAMPHCRIATLPHYHITTLPHYHIATLPHCHIVALPHCTLPSPSLITIMPRCGSGNSIWSVYYFLIFRRIDLHLSARNHWIRVVLNYRYLLSC
jgi:hypothetical protein